MFRKSYSSLFAREYINLDETGRYRYRKVERNSCEKRDRANRINEDTFRSSGKKGTDQRNVSNRLIPSRYCSTVWLST